MNTINEVCQVKNKEDNDFLLRTSALNQSDVENLVSGKILAISIENYMETQICNEVANKILKNDYNYYNYAENVVGRYGMSFSEINASDSKFLSYYSQSIPSINKIRSLFSPYMAPIDKLRLELEEMWGMGAKLEQVHPDNKMFVGLCRVIEPNKIVLPHQDDIRWDSSNETTSAIINQLAVNLYLKTPEVGGELELWDFGYEKDEYQILAEGNYGISKSKISNPKITINPKVGEIIIFNPRNLHCILPGDGLRLTQSCFIGYRGKEFPLTYWS